MTNFFEYKQSVYNIIGAAMHVHSTLNFGLLEQIYQEALSYELTQRGIENEREKEIDVYYGTHLLEKKYKADIVAGDVVIELKAVRKTLPEHRSQLCNYLRLTKKPVGLLLNFGEKSLHGERWVYDKYSNECVLVDMNMNPLPMDDIVIG